jgi:hypothetical protein
MQRHTNCQLPLSKQEFNWTKHTHIVLPDIGGILKAEEQHILQTHFDTAGVTQTLIDAIQRVFALSNRPGTGDARMTTALRSKRSDVPTLALWIITGITTAVLLYSPCV